MKNGKVITGAMLTIDLFIYGSFRRASIYTVFKLVVLQSAKRRIV